MELDCIPIERSTSLVNRVSNNEFKTYINKMKELREILINEKSETKHKKVEKWFEFNKNSKRFNSNLLFTSSTLKLITLLLNSPVNLLQKIFE